MTESTNILKLFATKWEQVFTRFPSHWTRDHIKRQGSAEYDADMRRITAIHASSPINMTLIEQGMRRLAGRNKGRWNYLPTLEEVLQEYDTLLLEQSSYRPSQSRSNKGCQKCINGDGMLLVLFYVDKGRKFFMEPGARPIPRFIYEALTFCDCAKGRRAMSKQEKGDIDVDHQHAAAQRLAWGYTEAMDYHVACANAMGVTKKVFKHATGGPEQGKLAASGQNAYRSIGQVSSPSDRQQIAQMDAQAKQAEARRPAQQYAQREYPDLDPLDTGLF